MDGQTDGQTDGRTDDTKAISLRLRGGIINHQLELSVARVKYLDHEKMAYEHEIWSYRISEKASYIAYSGVSRETRCLNVVWSLLQLAYFVYARSKSPGEVMGTCRLIGAFATRQCNMNHHLVC